MSAERPDDARDAPAPAWERVALLLSLLYRLAYHAAFFARDPFARATVSDGRWYELSARDLLAHPPFGTEPFYLQGSYAAQLAVFLALAGSVRGALVLQVALAFVGLFVFHHACGRVLAAREQALSTLTLLSSAAVLFYENKPLSIAQGVTASVFALAATLRALEGAPSRWVLASGALSGVALLARPSAALAAPFALVALARVAHQRDGARGSLRVAGLFALGVAIALAPMALRNAAVTGRPTVLRAHAGAAAFYTGNNPRSRGLWNNGGVFSGELPRELLDAADALQVAPGAPRAERERLAARELERRAWAFLSEDKPRALALFARKLWLSLGNDELSQDYDWRGERALVPFSQRVYLPFGVLLGLGLLGAWSLYDRSAHTRVARAALFVVAGQGLATLVTLVVYFTSSQHRALLVVPLAFCAGPGARLLVDRVRAARARPRALAVPLVVLLACAAQGALARAEDRAERGPSSVHWFNLSLVYDRLGERDEARASLDRAIARRGDHPLYLLTRATWRARDGALDGAREDLARVAALPPSRRTPAIEAQRAALARALGVAP